MGEYETDICGIGHVSVFVDDVCEGSEKVLLLIDADDCLIQWGIRDKLGKVLDLDNRKLLSPALSYEDI